MSKPKPTSSKRRARTAKERHARLAAIFDPTKRGRDPYDGISAGSVDGPINPDAIPDEPNHVDHEILEPIEPGLDVWELRSLSTSTLISLDVRQDDTRVHRGADGTWSSHWVATLAYTDRYDVAQTLRVEDCESGMAIKTAIYRLAKLMTI